MSYIRLIRLYWRTGKAWDYSPLETIIEICFALFWKTTGWDHAERPVKGKRRG